MRILTFGRSTSIQKRGSTKRRILSAAAILQIAGGIMNPSAQAQPPQDEAFEMKSSSKKSALEILKAMTPDKMILRSGKQAWIPGGYLGMSKSWG